MTDDPGQATEFCGKEFRTKHDDLGIELVHNCYLNLGHKGPCVCGWCEDFPIEIHPFEPGGN